MKLKMFQLNNVRNNISSILGPEVEIKGDVTVSGDLLIYGKVYGDILSKGEIISAKGSKVVGNIYAHNASISGKIEGNLEVESKAILGISSHLTGNLKASIITIEEGARFDGMCSMIQKETTTNTEKSKTQTSRSLNAANEQI